MSISKRENAIKSLSDWRRLAPPKADHHWEEGRSAVEVAKAWIEGGGAKLPEEVRVALESDSNFGAIETWNAEPEAKLRFDSFPGEPRNTDLLVNVADAYGRYIVAVEAKADESYSETLIAAFAAAIERRIENPRSNGVNRIQFLAQALLKPKWKGSPAAANLRYQLFTACLGAVAEAHRQNVTRAVMLIHEFYTDKTTDANHERNNDDLKAFLTRLSGCEVAAVEQSRLYGPFIVKDFNGVQLFVGKVSRNLRT